MHTGSFFQLCPSRLLDLSNIKEKRRLFTGPGGLDFKQICSLPNKKKKKGGERKEKKINC